LIAAGLEGLQWVEMRPPHNATISALNFLGAAKNAGHQPANADTHSFFALIRSGPAGAPEKGFEMRCNEFGAPQRVACGALIGRGTASAFAPGG